jgi:autotransporter-associated beta strand protein
VNGPTAILDLGGTTQTQNGGVTLQGGGIIQNGTLFSSSTFDMQSGTVSAILAGSGAFTKSNSGTVVLSGINIYSGPTDVNGGTLEVDGSIANSSIVNVNSGGTLSGTGIVVPATTTIGPGGTLAPGNPGNPTGTLTITGNLAFQSGAIYLIQVTPGGARTLPGPQASPARYRRYSRRASTSRQPTRFSTRPASTARPSVA